MQAIPLGRVNVPVAGTPVTFASKLTAAQVAAIPPSGMVAKIEVWPDTQATGRVMVKVQGQVVAVLPVPSGGYPVPWSVGDGCGNLIPYSQFSLDAAISNDGSYVTLWVE